MSSHTIENYVKAIYLITTHQELTSNTGSRESPPAASTGMLAEALGVLPGSVTNMLKTLQASGLADYRPYEGVTLTQAGQALALRVLRRHRLIELFLCQTLSLTWDEVHEEAENMEHAVSDWLIDRIDNFLGMPATDPHGDPIPRPDGSIAATDYVPLTTLNVGACFRLVRVMDQSVEFLKYLTDQGLEIDSVSALVELAPSAGVLRIRRESRDVVLAYEAAGKLMVRREPV
ncbi:MAG: metal-dependent transcriptional regulator [Planctomycetales bacterium]|nr:metal-dependent transcriptional regulator [Planctomycetales bacterium]